MKAVYLSLYKKKGTDGTTRTVFRYGLSGTPDELKKYEETIKNAGYEMAVDDATKKPIFFNTIYRGPSCEVIITDTGKVVVNDNKFDQMQSQLQLATDPALKQALAGAIAQHMVAQTMGTAQAVSSIPVAAPSAQAAPTEEELEPGDANLGE